MSRLLEHDEFISLLNEVCGCGDSDGIEMVMQNLAKIHEYSGEIMALCQGGDDLEDWIEDKISKCSQMVEDIKHYLEYRSHAGEMNAHAQTFHQPDDVGDHLEDAHGMEMLPAQGETGEGLGNEGGDARMAGLSKTPEMTPPSGGGGGLSGDEAPQVLPSDPEGESEEEVEVMYDDEEEDEDDESGFSLTKVFGTGE